jgi:hypothetical protein
MVQWQVPCFKDMWRLPFNGKIVEATSLYCSRLCGACAFSFILSVVRALVLLEPSKLACSVFSFPDVVWALSPAVGACFVDAVLAF